MHTLSPKNDAVHIPEQEVLLSAAGLLLLVRGEVQGGRPCQAVQKIKVILLVNLPFFAVQLFHSGSRTSCYVIVRI